MNQKLFAGEVKILLKQGKIDDTQDFWKTFEQSNYQDSASHYCLQLFENLINPEKKESVIQNEQKIYSTLLALQYYKNRKPKNEQTIKACKQYIEKNSCFSEKWILQLFMSSHKDEQFAQNFMNGLALIPKDIDWALNTAQQIQYNLYQIKRSIESKRLRMEKKQGPNLNSIRRFTYPQPVGIQMKAMSLSYVCFLDYIRGNSNEMRIDQYEYMISVLNALMNCGRISNFWLNYLCVFLHFIMNCITFYSCPDQNIIRELLVLSNQVRNCWGIVGEMGSELFDISHKQLRVPGHAFRKKLRRDFPALDMKDSSFLNNEYYLISESQDSFSCPEDRSLLNLRKLMVWHIMKVSYLQQEQISFYIDMLRTISQDMAYQLYFKSMKIVDISSQLEVYEKIKQVMKEKMLQLLKQTYEKWKAERRKASQMQIQQFDSLINETNTLHIFRYPSYQIVHVPLIQFSNPRSKTNFFVIFQKMRRQQSNLLFYQGSLSIIFYGTSLNFIGVVQILTKFLLEADIQECRQLRVFYLPKPQLDYKPQVGCYIASKDIWYSNFIYNVFKQRMIFPPLELKKSNKGLFPSYLMNRSLHMYLREAKRIFNLKVYKCVLKIKDAERLEVIYFTESVLIGLFAEAEFIRLNKIKTSQKAAKYENIDAVEIIKEKMNKMNTIIADIGFEYEQPLTNKIISKRQENMKILDVQICNLPRQNFFGDKPDPAGNTLKLSILSEANSRVFLKEIRNMDNFRENKSNQQICLAFKDIFINYSIKELSLKNKQQDSLLKVIVDGVVYNKVEGLKIESPLSVNKLPISIPIQTFLPFK